MGSTHIESNRSASVLTPRVGGVAGILFIVFGAVELALAGGPPPNPTASAATLERYIEAASAAAPVVAILSGLAGAMLLVFAAALRELVADIALSRIVWAGGILTVAMGFAGQAAHQMVLQTSGADGGLLALVGFLFLFAVVSGGIMAAAAGTASLRDSTPPKWLGVLGFAVLVVELVLAATPTMAGVAFPVFLVWLLAASVWMFRFPVSDR